MANEETCRCGYKGPPEGHPCHRCHEQTGTPRYIAQPIGTYSLAGNTLKMNAYQTWGCDKCWNEYKELNKNEMQ